MELFATKILKDLGNEQFEKLVACLDSEKQGVIRSMKDADTALTALTSALFIRYIIRQRLGLEQNEMHFGAYEYDKPYLIGNDTFHFNISHSGDFVVCAIDETPLGIDIEKIEYQNPKIVLDVLSEVELAQYNKLSAKKKIPFFYSIWARKESYLKALGMGLNTKLSDITVSSRNKIFSPVVRFVLSEKMHIKQYRASNNYALAVCASHKNFPEKIERISTDEVLNLDFSL